VLQKRKKLRLERKEPRETGIQEEARKRKKKIRGRAPVQSNEINCKRREGNTRSKGEGKGVNLKE